jgi:DNA helicase II / ATP-dependent DNA helicase PcrA
VVIDAGGEAPSAADGWPRLRIDDSTLAAPLTAVATLEEAWRNRQPTVVELAVPFAALKQPETCNEPPYNLDPDFEFTRERLHFLVWANRYDGRRDDLVWHHAVRAERLGATLLDNDGDVRLPDGTAVWIDGGPRTSDVLDTPILHANQLLAGSLVPDHGAAPADDLAPDQLAAVAHPGGSARVLAPAGSGKTRVLTGRLRHLLVDRGWASETVTALAYNTRAAEEMRSRSTDLAEARIRTLHAFGYELIGRAHQGKPRVLDEMEVRRELERILRLRIRANEDVYAPYLEALSEVRSGLWSPEEVEARRDDVPDFADAFRQYRDVLDRRGAIDFDEQIYGAVEVLLSDPAVRQWARSRCAHLLVDELQDLTPAQLLMIRLLSAPAYDVFGVGDDDQVIYGYAGADPRFLVDYADYFPGAASYLLEVNYRCPPDVVDAASHLLSYNHVRVPKTVRAAPDRTPGLRVERHDDASIGAKLVEAVEAALAEGARPSDVAILTRVNAGLLAPQVLLGEAGVPLVPVVDDRMLERTGMRAALAWLRLAHSASGRGLLAGTDLGTAVRRPSRSLSPGLMNAVSRGDWSLSRLSGFADSIDDARLSGALGGFHDDLQRLGKLARSGATTADLLGEIRDSVGLGGSLDRLDSRKAPGGNSHIDDLDALLLVALRHPDATDFELWLRDHLRRERERPDEYVTLSTVHRVKGLEWPHVVVWDASDGVFPHRLAATPEEQEEERRVFHVALTRARETSTVFARSESPSPFLAEMTGTAPRVKPRPVPAPEDRSGLRSSEAGTKRAELSGDAAVRGERLREWRRQRAKDDGVPAYVVLHDRHLDALAERAPQSLSELAKCDGIGPTKLDRYGDAIIEVLAAGNGDSDA